MVIQGPKIGRQPDKEIEHFEKPDRANQICGNRKISSKFILASLLEIGFAAGEKIVSTSLAQDICARLT